LVENRFFTYISLNFGCESHVVAVCATLHRRMINSDTAIIFPICTNTLQIFPKLHTLHAAVFS